MKSYLDFLNELIFFYIPEKMLVIYVLCKHLFPEMCFIKSKQLKYKPAYYSFHQYNKVN